MGNQYICENRKSYTHSILQYSGENRLKGVLSQNKHA